MRLSYKVKELFRGYDRVVVPVGVVQVWWIKVNKTVPHPDIPCKVLCCYPEVSYRIAETPNRPDLNTGTF